MILLYAKYFCSTGSTRADSWLTVSQRRVSPGGVLAVAVHEFLVQAAHLLPRAAAEFQVGGKLAQVQLHLDGKAGHTADLRGRLHGAGVRRGHQQLRPLQQRALGNRAGLGHPLRREGREVVSLADKASLFAGRVVGFSVTDQNHFHDKNASSECGCMRCTADGYTVS